MFYLRDSLGNELNWFDDFANLFGSERKGFMASDLVEDPKEYKLTVDVPGVDKKNITINFNNNNLVVSYKQDGTNNVENKKYIRRERYQASCERSFYLADGDESNIHAKLEDGLLKITVGKKNHEIDKSNVISIE